MNISKTLFKKLYRDYRIAQNAVNANGDYSLIRAYQNSLGSHSSHQEILKKVQNVYIDARRSAAYTIETSDYLFFMLTK